MYSGAHRAATIDLARRCLLEQDAAEAEAIVDVLTRDTIGVVSFRDGRVVGVALGSVGHKDPTAGHLDLLMVDPSYRRRGIGRDMLARLEARMRERDLKAVKVFGNAPDYAWPGVDVHYTAAICALTAAGYSHDSTAWNMTAPLPVRQPPRSPKSADVLVRRASKDDLALLLPMVDGQWGPRWAAEVQRAVTGSGAVHAAFRDGEPVAFAAWGGCRPSWFGPMGTLPAAAGLGLGSVLLRRCLDDQAELGLSNAQIGWVGPVPFYANAVDAFIDRVFFHFSKPL